MNWFHNIVRYVTRNLNLVFAEKLLISHQIRGAKLMRIIKICLQLKHSKKAVLNMEIPGLVKKHQDELLLSQNIQEEIKTLSSKVKDNDDKRNTELISFFIKVSRSFEDIAGTLLPGFEATLDAPQDLIIENGWKPSFKGKQSVTDNAENKHKAVISFLLAMLHAVGAPFFVLNEVDSSFDASDVRLIREIIQRDFPKSQIMVVSGDDRKWSGSNP